MKIVRDYHSVADFDPMLVPAIRGPPRRISSPVPSGIMLNYTISLSYPACPTQLPESLSMRFARPALLGCLALVVIAVAGWKVGDPPAVEMKTFADAFLSTLDDDQKARAVLPYDTPKRVQWHFIPMDTRKGLVLSDMNTAQRTAALRLVRAALSEAGYDKTSKIMALEGVLRQFEGEGRRWARDPEKYYVTIFGQPTNSGAWGLSFEGHHVSLNFVCNGGVVVDSTPQFFAANPATIMNDAEGPVGKGTRVLRQEEQLAFDLVNSLSESQLDKAMIAEEAPKEIRFAGEAQVKVGKPEGISQTDLTGKQRGELRKLINVYIDAVPDKVADERRAVIDRDGWDNIHFAWAGATKPEIGHYYRVRGKSFLIEFVNTQPDAKGNPANHIHCVWRDVTGDFDLPAGQ